MSKKNKDYFRGTVINHYGGIKFLVEVDNLPDPVQAHLGGRLQKNNIRLTIGDIVMVDISEYDISKGIIKSRV